MPLVAPGINSFNSGEVVPQHQEWANVLMGKTIGEKNSVTTFAKSDLPENARIIKPGQSMTQDFREDRLNIHLADDGTVREVKQG